MQRLCFGLVFSKVIEEKPSGGRLGKGRFKDMFLVGGGSILRCCDL